MPVLHLEVGMINIAAFVMADALECETKA